MDTVYTEGVAKRFAMLNSLVATGKA